MQWYGRLGADRFRRDVQATIPGRTASPQTRATPRTSISAANARIHGDYLPTFAVASIAAVNAVALRPRPPSWRPDRARPADPRSRSLHLAARRRIWTAIVIGLDRRDGPVGGVVD